MAYTLGQATGYTIYYGRVLTPEVMTIELYLDNGHTLRETPRDGIFMLISESTISVSELRLLDMDGQVLQRLDGTELPPLIWTSSE